VQDLLRCAKYLVVAAMVVWVHPGPSRKGKSEDGGAFGAVKSFSGSISKVAAHPGLTRRSLANRRPSGPSVAAMARCERTQQAARGERGSAAMSLRSSQLISDYPAFANGYGTGVDEMNARDASGETNS
jgi:hypothetical protein